MLKGPARWEPRVRLPITMRHGISLERKILLAFLAGGAILLGAGIGVAFFPEDALDLSGLIAAADEAMYTAKRAGRNRIAFYATAVATSDSTAPAVPAA